MLQTDSITALPDSLSAYYADLDSLSDGRDSVVHHAFSPWRIAQQMPGCTPQQLDSAIQANLPVREKIRSTRPDTLSLPGLPGHKTYEALNQVTRFDDNFFSKDPAYHPELPFRSTGESAVPLPYMLWRDDWVTGSLLLCLVILVLTINKTRQQLRQQTKDFFFAPKENKGLFAVETTIEGRARLFMTFQLCLLGGVMMFAYSQYELDFFLGQLSPRWLLGIYVLSFIAFFFLKKIMSAFVNWIFFPKSQQKLWNDNYSYLISVESILFFPLALTFVYFRLPFEKVVWIFLFILLIIKILLAFKTYRIFFSKSYGLFHLFAYLCALEIMPMLALWKTLAMVTENLIVKY